MEVRLKVTEGTSEVFLNDVTIPKMKPGEYVFYKHKYIPKEEPKVYTIFGLNIEQISHEQLISMVKQVIDDCNPFPRGLCKK